MFRRPLVVLVLAFLAGLQLACGDDGEGPGAGGVPSAGEVREVTVTATDFAFTPAEISAEPGQAVRLTFVNGGGVRHSFTVPGLDIDVVAEPGEQADVEFTVGEDDVAFYCKFHQASMAGTVSVSGGGSAGAGTGSGGDNPFRY